MLNLPVADIHVEVRRPTHREMGIAGTTLADTQREIENASSYASLELGHNETSLFRAATVETAMDPAVQQTTMAIARTIANLDNAEVIRLPHLMEAINYRPLKYYC